MFHRLLAIVLSHLAMASFAVADDGASGKNTVESLRQQGYSVGMITPIFGQLLALSMPKGFRPVMENTAGGQYIQESVLDGESTKKWSQMITITGAKGLASNPNATPQKLADRIAGGFKRDCPDSFSGTGLGAIKLNGHDAFGAVISCGIAVPTGEPYSESLLLFVIKGEQDYYTVQWAERGAASSFPIKFDDAKWAGRMKSLAPIKLCPIVPGESAPFPSCVSRK